MSITEEMAIMFEPLETLNTSDIVGINLSDMHHHRFNIKELSQEINIDPEVLEAKNNWYKYNGEYYYFKTMFLASKLINELLGEYIATYMDIPTVKYDLALKNDKVVGLLSKNFREMGVKYVSAKNLRKYEYFIMRWILVSSKLSDLREMIDRMLVKDFYTCLSDRRSNILCIRDGFNIKLAPFYDYELSFYNINYEKKIEEYNEYYNPLFVANPLDKYSDMLAISYDDIRKMMKRDDYLAHQFDKMMAFEITEALEDIKSKYKLNINPDIYNYYVNFSEIRKKELIKNIRK